MLTDRIALVTGGAQGLGAAICLRLAREGCDVVVADLNREQAEQTALAVANETGRRAIALPVNVADEEQVRDMVDAVVSEFGRLDILVANAGVVRSSPVDEMSLRDWSWSWT